MSLSWGPRRTVLTVSELNARIRALLDDEFGDVWISGEVSGCRPAASGHFYFTLKDRGADPVRLSSAPRARYLKFKPQDGVAVLARGRIDVLRGARRVPADRRRPRAAGPRRAAARLRAAQEEARGRGPVRRGAQAAAARAAAAHRRGHVADRRRDSGHAATCSRGASPACTSGSIPAQVQGEGSVEDGLPRHRLLRALRVGRGGDRGARRRLARGPVDLQRGAGGARHRRVPVPVISAVGHETDFTIADFVADLRAPTPSAAAELVICTREQLLERSRDVKDSSAARSGFA